MGRLFKVAPGQHLFADPATSYVERLCQCWVVLVRCCWLARYGRAGYRQENQPIRASKNFAENYLLVG